MTFRVEVSGRAQRDLDRIYAGLARQVPYHGTRWFDRFRGVDPFAPRIPREVCLREESVNCGATREEASVRPQETSLPGVLHDHRRCCEGTARPPRSSTRAEACIDDSIETPRLKWLER